MNEIYGKDLDLNLLRVFVVVAEAGSVTAAAQRLYLTQPAVSAALRRLADLLGEPLFARSGRGLALTTRGQRLLASARPHLSALVNAALVPVLFDPTTSPRTFRLGLSDSSEGWLVPPLLGVLTRQAPHTQLIVVPVQFRSVAALLSRGELDIAVTVADEMPAGTLRRTLFVGGFVCLYDPRHARIKKRLTLQRYLEHDHVIVSYNADLRGVVEDAHGIQRRVRLSIPSFHSVGAVIDGSALLATVPAMVAKQITIARPHLATALLPFDLSGTPIEMLWPRATDGDEALGFLREHIASIAAQAGA